MLERRTFYNEVVGYVSPILTRIGVPHVFSTRIGGISTGAYSSLNLGNPTHVPTLDALDNIQQNYLQLHLAIGCGDRRRLSVHQVHGNIVKAHDPAQPFNCADFADAVLTTDPNCLASIRTADCVPVLMSDLTGRRVAAVHAGWRGVVGGVVLEALQHFPDPKKVAIAIGPSIGIDHFEVGMEVVEKFTKLFGQDAPLRYDTARNKRYIDLRKSIELQLIRNGVHADLIDTTDRCTVRDEDEFFSHRRDKGYTGRMASTIGVIV